ncbi:MAG: NAD(P)/FAD-dependent oxidoreductase [Solirubrobacterales bacterium]|nr:NAD(P)/FAD-dependent oxidoreductase [Solirubrobacterales bacterium]MCB0863376.1 NAD(P)/FAD-dependent oxidoreductase [Solirubrobacterales bacterium]MCB8914885.1 NAD(P)/FAD-dependent oxidoreductase [Thermoleophilales bacterium]
MAWNIVIVGGGFAGANVARHLEKVLPRQSSRLTLVNDVNFLLYTPLLPEAAAGTLEPRHVVTPLREILHRTNLRLGVVDAHDRAAGEVTLRGHMGQTEQIPYDHLVLAPGSISRFLPVPGLNEHAVGFKSLADAIFLRNHLIETLEMANATDDRELREELLTYVFVGGGYAGLEALAELQDFAADAMRDYPKARLHGMRWVLVEAADRVLPEIDRELADYAVDELRGRGIDIKLATTLDEVTETTATISTGEVIPTRTVVWTAGVVPNPGLRNFDVPLDDKGRVKVDSSMAVEGAEGVWSLGDSAAVPNPKGGVCPPTAQHAVRQAPVVAANIAAAIGLGEPETFDYQGYASFVNLGRYKAVGKVGDRTFRGFKAWWMARSYHMSQIPGASRKARAVIDWTASLPFSRDISEVGSIGRPGVLSPDRYAHGGSHRPVEGELPAAGRDRAAADATAESDAGSS